MALLAKRNANWKINQLKNIPIGRVDHLQTLYNATRSKSGSDVVEIKARGDLPKAVDSVEKQ